MGIYLQSVRDQTEGAHLFFVVALTLVLLRYLGTQVTQIKRVAEGQIKILFSF